MAHKFKLEIETGNAAFGDSDAERGAEIARILRDVALRLDKGDEYGVIHDSNGNRVGEFIMIHEGD
jgi:hypothetical protein